MTALQLTSFRISELSGKKGKSMRPNASINVSVSNHYGEPTYSSEVTSQGLLGERVEIIEHTPLFTKICQSDNYTSWVSSDQVTRCDEIDGTPLLVTSHFMRIHLSASTSSDCLKDAVIGCRLMMVEEQDGWYRVTTPDGQKGWAEKKHFGAFPECSAENILALARSFLGYQYVWGGRSPKGFDCSGFVQSVFGLHGVTLPRDSWQQQKQFLVSNNHLDAEPGDLLFFARTPERISHVAIAVNNKRFIHASGWVKYNSLLETESDFSKSHLQTFVSINRYPMQETCK